MSEKTRRTPAQRQSPTAKSPTVMRLFLAVPLPEPVIGFVDTIITDLQRDNWPIRWINPGNAHMTLQFLGNVSPEQTELLRIALRDPIATHAGFDLRTANLGVFPNIKRPRVLWLGLYGPAHRLQTLHDEIGAILTQLEFQIDAAEFHPHITLGRLKNDRSSIKTLPDRIRARFEALQRNEQVTDKKPIPVPVREVHLVRSLTNAEGVRYEILERFPLGEPVS
jgi:2'-5' RNA ligase